MPLHLLYSVHPTVQSNTYSSNPPIYSLHYHHDSRIRFVVSANYYYYIEVVGQSSSSLLRTPSLALLDSLTLLRTRPLAVYLASLGFGVHMVCIHGSGL